MNCDRARRLFGACWDDELTLAERDWLEGHFTSCGRCRGEYDQFSRAVELAGALPRVEASAGLAERVLARTRRASTVPDHVGEPAKVRWTPVAAAAALVIVAGLLVTPQVLRGPLAPGEVPAVAGSQAPAPPMEMIPGPTVETVAAQRMPELRRGAQTQVAAIPDSIFDHSEDVDFILDPVTLRGGRVDGPRMRAPGVQGERAIITF